MCGVAGVVMCAVQPVVRGILLCIVCVGILEYLVMIVSYYCMANLAVRYCGVWVGKLRRLVFVLLGDGGFGLWVMW